MTSSRIDSSYPVEEVADLEPLILKSSSALGCGFSILLLISVVWNGFVAFAAFQMIPKQNVGWGNWASFLFLVPFLLVGLALILGTIYVGLSIFNPRPILVCSQQYLYPGEEFELSWMFPKSSGRISSLAIYIEGNEQASYRQGTTTRTETHVFYREAVLESSRREEFERGEKLIRLPSNVMHTFETSNNKIVWHVRFHGQIPWWPDLSDSFTLQVLPPKVDS